MSVQTYREQDFEDHVAGHLTASGYRLGASADYDRRLVLLPDEVVRFIRDTQPEGYDKLRQQYGDRTDENVVRRISDEVRRRGTLDVLRKGVPDRGVTLRLVYFRPSNRLNPEHGARYRQNRFTVVRQLRYSQEVGNSLDLALFVNGLPVFTAELKNAETGQLVGHAVKQYTRDRDPREPLFAFRRTLAHFAVGTEEVYYTTRLRGEKTFFLPFNKGTADGGRGNPENPDGHATHYLWEDVWAPDTVLDLLQNYLHVQETTEKVWDAKRGEVVEETSETLIFPRYHQLDVVRTLLRRAAADGPGRSYLVQHSAGSGKSNSIAWTAHGLRQLYDADGGRVFDTVVVVTDRTVLDKQLQDTVKQFEQTTGTVVPITETSQQLRQALERGRDIVVTTIQKFPVISTSIGDLGGNAFAVVIDEAHSSQSGESAKGLKEALAPSEALSDVPGEPEGASDGAGDLEDLVAAEVRLRGRQDHVSYFAFTATPKGKTLELFGRRGADGQFHAHHLYSMRQAIEEGFILDVLKGYTTYKRYFKLVRAVEDDEEYETSRAVRALTSYVDLSDTAVEEKARVALDLFLDTTARHLRGRGRAMFVTRSRLHAVRYFLQFRKLMQQRGLAYAPLVAFSGTVHDPQTGASHTEASLNGLGYRQKIEDAFKTPDYRLLVVANKYQTGFDEPLLTTMVVDKVLGGVQAVQTLSRLNRQAAGKETVVLDFVNEPDAILDAFKPYYQGAVLEEETDPNKLYDLQRQLDDFEVYTPDDVDEYARAFFDPSVSGEKIQPPLIRALNQWRARPEEEREDFRSALQSFVRLYAYVSQLVTFVDTGLEKAYVFARSLDKKLDPRERGGLPDGILDSVDLDSFRIQKTFEGQIELEPDPTPLPGIPTEAGGGVTEPETDYLSNIITNLNETYGVDLTERDRVRVEEIVEDVRRSDEVRAVMTGDNTRSGQKHVVDRVVDDRVHDEVSASVDLFKKLSDPRANRVLKARLFDMLVREFSEAA